MVIGIIFLFTMFCSVDAMDKWDYFSSDYKKEYKTTTTPLKKFEVRPDIHKWEEEKNKMNDRLFLEINKRRPKSPPHFHKKVPIHTDSYKNGLYKGEKTVGDCKQFLQSLKVKVTSDEISPGTYHRLKKDINCLDKMLNTYGIEHLEAIQNNWMDTEKALIYYRQLCQRKDAHDSIKKAARDFIEKNVNIKNYVHIKMKNLSQCNQFDKHKIPVSQKRYDEFIESQKIDRDTIMNDMRMFMEKHNFKPFDASKLSDTVDFLDDLPDYKKSELKEFAYNLYKYGVITYQSGETCIKDITQFIQSFFETAYEDLSINQIILLSGDILKTMDTITWSWFKHGGVKTEEWEKNQEAMSNAIAETMNDSYDFIKDNHTEIARCAGKIAAQYLIKLNPAKILKPFKIIGVMARDYKEYKKGGNINE